MFQSFEIPIKLKVLSGFLLRIVPVYAFPHGPGALPRMTSFDAQIIPLTAESVRVMQGAEYAPGRWATTWVNPFVMCYVLNPHSESLTERLFLMDARSAELHLMHEHLFDVQGTGDNARLHFPPFYCPDMVTVSRVTSRLRAELAEDPEEFDLCALAHAEAEEEEHRD